MNIIRTLVLKWVTGLYEWLDRAFCWAYDGSEEEIQSVYDGEIPPKYMSPRQREVIARFPGSEFLAHCCHCGWKGTLAEATSDECPNCCEAVWIDPFEIVDRNPPPTTHH